jgi:hypothetical protein
VPGHVVDRPVVVEAALARPDEVAGDLWVETFSFFPDWEANPERFVLFTFKFKHYL